MIEETTKNGTQVTLILPTDAERDESLTKGRRITLDILPWPGTLAKVTSFSPIFCANYWSMPQQLRSITCPRCHFTTTNFDGLTRTRCPVCSTGWCSSSLCAKLYHQEPRVHADRCKGVQRYQHFEAIFPNDTWFFIALAIAVLLFPLTLAQMSIIYGYDTLLVTYRNLYELRHINRLEKVISTILVVATLPVWVYIVLVVSLLDSVRLLGFKLKGIMLVMVWIFPPVLVLRGLWVGLREILRSNKTWMVKISQILHEVIYTGILNACFTPIDIIAHCFEVTISVTWSNLKPITSHFSTWRPKKSEVFED